MIWVAPSERKNDNAALEKRLWNVVDQFRANSGLKSQEYSALVLGLIFVRCRVGVQWFENGDKLIRHALKYSYHDCDFVRPIE